MENTKKLPAKTESLDEFLGFVLSSASNLGFTPERSKEIELVAEEVLVNVFDYAYPERDGDVELRCRAERPGALVLEIEDKGIPFDIRSLGDPDLSADIEDRQVGGLGVFFIRSLSDDIQYRREDGRNILTLVMEGRG